MISPTFRVTNRAYERNICHDNLALLQHIWHAFSIDIDEPTQASTYAT